MTTPIDRESVDPLHFKHPVDGIIRRLDEHYDVQSDVEQDPCGAWFAIQNLCAALDAAEAENKRLRELIPRPDQTEDELVWRDHMRGVPLAALAKEFGATKERMRHRLKKIAERKLHLTGGKTND